VPAPRPTRARLRLHDNKAAERYRSGGYER